MEKYFWAFKMSIARVVTYRLDLIMGRIRNIIVLLLLYYVWLTLSAGNGQFAGLSAQELTTYVFLASILRRLLFGGDSRQVSQDINEGKFSLYLTRPVNHFVFNYFEELAERVIQICMSILEAIIIGFILHINFFAQTEMVTLFLFAASVFLAHILFYIMTYCLSLISFWSRESMGPRFLFDWFVDFAAGSYFPLHILTGIFWQITLFLPFMYLVYAPIMIYLGRLTGAQSLRVLFIQIMSIIIVGIITNTVWKKGLEHYSGDGS